MKPIRLDLKNKNGEIDTFVEDTVPMQKLIDALKLQDEFENEKIKTNVDGAMKKIEFVASCFQNSKVTSKRILEGLDAREFEEKIDGIIHTVMGIDEESKKSETEKLSAQEK